MSANLRHGPFTRHLMEEHRLIERMLGLLWPLYSKLLSHASSTVLFLDLLERLETVVVRAHHAKEETILFPKLEALGVRELDGPNCTEFTQRRIEWDDVGAIRQRAQRAGIPTLDEHDTLTNSPLRVPKEEHSAGALAVEMIRRELKSLKAGDTEVYARLGSCLRDYLLLMRMHIRKEDECLFQIVDRRISVDVQEEMLAHAIELERELGLQLDRDVTPFLIQIEEWLKSPGIE